MKCNLSSKYLQLSSFLFSQVIRILFINIDNFSHLTKIFFILNNIEKIKNLSNFSKYHLFAFISLTLRFNQPLNHIYLMVLCNITKLLIVMRQNIEILRDKS